jgi:hypothetical protein
MIAEDDRALLNKIADIAGVPGPHRERFIGYVWYYVYATCIESRSRSRPNADALLPAAKAVRAARGAVAKLTPQQRGALGVILKDLREDLTPNTNVSEALYHHILELPPRNTPHEMENNLVLALLDEMDAAFGILIGRNPHAPSGKRGKPDGAKAQWAMHYFVVQLWEFSSVYGDVTLSNSGGQAKGSIVEMLDILKPMLPNQFFPGVLNYSFLRNVQKSLPPYVAKLKRLGKRPV